MNDTGSNVLTLYDSDLTRMGNSTQYNGWENVVTFDTASGSAAFRSLLVKVQLLDEHDQPWSSWIKEYALVRDDDPSVVRPPCAT